MALIDKLSAIGNAIRAKTGKEALLTLDEMPTEIGAIESGGGGTELPEEAYVVSDQCNYRFAYNNWNWYLDTLGSKITTRNITSMSNMFVNSNKLTSIPFEINCGDTAMTTISMFDYCSKLTSIPKINNCKPTDMSRMFSNCYHLRELPSDIGTWFKWDALVSLSSAYQGSRANTFSGCYSLRSAPMDFLAYGNPIATYSYSIYPSCFSLCYAIDEIVDLPNPHTNTTWTSNAFSGTFNSCHRIKNMTFAMPDGQPYQVNWKSQTIDLSSLVGYAGSALINNVVSYNSGITQDKQVKDDTTYQALKNDPDWYTKDIAYSRYNHDSAVATINSLPDASAYLSTAGGTNTIKFKGDAGSATDGGAINTLTAEEIAVATAKGWTVTFA